MGDFQGQTVYLPEGIYLYGTVMNDYLIVTILILISYYLLVWVNSDHEPFTTIMLTININGHEISNMINDYCSKNSSYCSKSPSI